MYQHMETSSKHVKTATLSNTKGNIFFTKDVAECKLHVNRQLTLVCKLRLVKPHHCPVVGKKYICEQTAKKYLKQTCNRQ